ncbi:MAG: hypothetical protein Tsb0021_04860 [Chlamydiales bacterium]
MIHKLLAIFFLSFAYLGSFLSAEGNPYPPDQELTLEMLLDIALRNNPETRSAWANVRRSQGIYCQSLSNNQIAVDYYAYGRYHHLSKKDKKHNYTDYYVDNEIIASYLLFDFGVRKYTHQTTFFALRSAQKFCNWTFQTVMVEVIRRYSEYLDSIETYKVRQADLMDAKMNFEVAEALYDAGVKNRTDMLQARAAYVSTQIQLEVAKGEIQIALGALKNALGVTMDTPIEVKDLPKDFEPYQIHQKVESLINEAHKNRSDLQAGIEAIRQKNAEYCRALSDGYPTMTVEYGYGKKAWHRRYKENYRSDVALTLSVPIYRGYYFKNGVRTAKAALDQEVADYENALSNTAFEVLTNYWTFKTAYETFQYSIEFLEYAQESHDATLASYKAGMGNIQDLFEAQRELASARNAHVRAKTAWILSLANLTYSTGMLQGPDDPLCKQCSLSRSSP